MNIRHKDLIIDQETPFANCKLDREKYADVLTSIVCSYVDGFVLAINNEWGAGKTTFVKMWEQKLKDTGFHTLYFNAWENDFDANPLVALLAELKTISGVEDDVQFKSLVKKSAVIAKSIIPSVAKAFASRYIDSKGLLEAIEKVAEGAADVLKEEVDEFAKKKQGLKDFRQHLEEFVKIKSGEKPLIFIIDELDRCRPSYSVELLEQIKHFFSVPGIVFVLSIDKVQLGNAVKGFYGNDQIDSNKYLQRFIDLEYTLPQPDLQLYVDYLYQYFDFATFFSATQRKQHSEIHDDGDSFLRIAKSLLRKRNLSLRDIEKIFSHARIGLKSFQISSYVKPRIFFMLILIRLHYPDLFKAIKNKMLGFQDLITELRPIFPKEILNEEIRSYISLEAQMVWMYSNSYSPYGYISLYTKDESTGQNISTVKSVIETQSNSGDFIKFLNSNQESFYSNNLGIDYLINKIELMDPLYVIS